MSGLSAFETVSSLTTTSLTLGSEGTSNIVSISVRSTIARRPRAPLCRDSASREMAESAGFVNFSLTPSMSKRRWNCRTRLFFGFVRMSISASSVSSSSVATMGNRPMNSGMSPNFSRSSGWDCANSSPRRISALPFDSAPKPITFLPSLRWTIWSRPTNAPPAMKRMLLVSTCRNSCCGCLRPPFGGTFATVPSMIFRSACCTPSPETSRVIEGLSLLREILSISSM